MDQRADRREGHEGCGGFAFATARLALGWLRVQPITTPLGLLARGGAMRGGELRPPEQAVIAEGERGHGGCLGAGEGGVIFSGMKMKR